MYRPVNHHNWIYFKHKNSFFSPLDWHLITGSLLLDFDFDPQLVSTPISESSLLVQHLTFYSRDAIVDIVKGFGFIIRDDSIHEVNGTADLLTPSNNELSKNQREFETTCRLAAGQLRAGIIPVLKEARAELGLKLNQEFEETKLKEELDEIEAIFKEI